MSKTARDAPLGGCLRPWRDRRLHVLLSRIEGLRRCRAMGPAELDRPRERALRPQFPWRWGDTVGLLILLTFAALLLRSIIRW